MNGEVNGMMEEPSEKLVEGPDHLHNVKTAASEDCDVDADNYEPNVSETHHSNEAIKDILNTNEVDCPSSDNIKDEEFNSNESENTPVETLHLKGPSNGNKLDNHLSNSFEFCPEVEAKSDVAQAQSDGEDLLNNISPSEKNETSGANHAVKESTEQMESDSVHSEEVESTDESDVSAGPRAEDTVSVNSDSGAEGGDDTSQESQNKPEETELIIVGTEKMPTNQNGGVRESQSPEIHEIASDTEDSLTSKQNKSAKLPEIQLRRSSRAIKRKRYDVDLVNGDDDSDIEEVGISEPYRRRSRTIIIDDTKTLVEMAAKQMKANQYGNYKKEPTVVILDTHSIGTSRLAPHLRNSVKPTNSTMSAQSLYQSIVARGTTVTPIPTKSNASTQSPSPQPQPAILPSLTDDMFVVEAPSFIVPYVYEKPSIKPFREFVNVLGNELAEQRAKEDQAEREKSDKEEKGKDEELVLSEEEQKKDEEKEQHSRTPEPIENEQNDKNKPGIAERSELEQENKKKKAEQRESRKRGNDDDDASWDGESSTDSDEDQGSDEEDKTVVIKDKVDSVTEIKDVTELTVEKVVTGRSDNYFDCSLGKFFMNIGLNLVQEYVQTDLLKQQKRKLYRDKKSGQETKLTELSIMSLRKNLEFSKENNIHYSFPQRKCKLCSFQSESMLVMAHHAETPHMKNNVYKCNYCEFEIRSPHDILFHMEAEHNTRGKLERAPAYHQCANCPFEDNGKGKLARHLVACAKKFKPDFNLSPPVEWEPPAKIPKMTRVRNNMMGSYQNTYPRMQMPNNTVRPINIVFGPSMSVPFRPRGRAPMAPPARITSPQGAPIMRGGIVVRPYIHPTHFKIATHIKQLPLPKSVHQPSISITPLPRQPHPSPNTPFVQPGLNKNSGCVICEICDGYIKDLEQLRNHMQWIHKVKIHPKMIYNRPPLNCQKCQFRFFTDQGLERHLLGSHGLVTSSMQEAANKGKDAGRCPVCGRIYQWKLLNHVSRDHNLTLKPAHLSYKCTVCTATFGMYKQFENHVYSAHSVVAKRVMDKTKNIPPAVPKQADSLLRPLKINDEITIIPQPVRATSAATAASLSTATVVKDK